MKKLCLLLLVCTSCAPVYIPNLRNSPMFTKGGEFQLNVQGGNGLEGQTAASLTKNIGLIGNFSYIDRDRYREDDFHRHTFYEGGIGYFYNDDDMVLELFAGYGKGEGASSNEWLGVAGSSGKYERYFVQPGFGFNKRQFHFAFVPRVSIVDFYEFGDGALSVPVDEDPKVFFEPAFVGKVNTMNNHLYFTFQFGYSTKLSNDVYFDRRDFQIASGMGFRFGGVKSELKSR